MRAAKLSTVATLALILSYSYSSHALAQACNDNNQVAEYCDDICCPEGPSGACENTIISCGHYCPNGTFANGTQCSETCKTNHHMLPFNNKCVPCPYGTTRLAGDDKPSTCCVLGFTQTVAGGNCVELPCRSQGRPLVLPPCGLCKNKTVTCGDVCPEGSFANLTACSPYTTCSVDEFQTAAPSVSSDTECRKLTTCSVDEFQTIAPTATTDRQCQNLTICDVDEFQSLAPTATSNRQCQNLTAPCSADEFEAITPNATSDRLCLPITAPCSADEFEAIAPTDTNDRKCQTIRQCSTDEFETAAPTNTSDRQCQTITQCSAEEVEDVAPSTTSDRQCVCKENHFFNGTHCEGCHSGTRLQGDSKDGQAKTCCHEAYQSQAGATCTAYKLPTTCNNNEELIGGTASEDKHCSPCSPDKTSQNGQACQSFAEKEFQGNTKPNSKTTIVSAFRSTTFSSTKLQRRKQMQSMMKFLKQQIRALENSRIQMKKDELVLSDKFESKLGYREKIDVIAVKQKTTAKINSASACDEKDVDLKAQPVAYDISLEEQEAALVCSGNTPVTKLTMTREGALHGEDVDQFQYACWNGVQWNTAATAQSDDVYQCDGKNFYVNSLSGVTCNVSNPVSDADQNVIAGTTGADCGETLADGDSCSTQCNDNFVLIQATNCSTEGFMPAICQCPEGHQDNLDGTCSPCANNEYATQTNTLACSLHSVQHCDQGEFFTQGNTLQADSAQCTTCPEGTFLGDTQHTEETCTQYTTTEQTCNQQRKTFVQGSSKITDDASCGITCLDTQYASGTECNDKTLSCPAGFELIQSDNNYTDNTCTGCPQNTYKELSDDSQCQPCPAGHETFPLQSTSTATGCQVCDVATEYDHDGIASTGCVETPEHCHAGFQHTLTQDPTLPNLCTYCPEGTFQPNNHSTDACQPYSTTATECNQQRRKLIQGSSKITDDAKCGALCSDTQYASGTECIAYTNTATTCNANNAKVILGQDNHTDDSQCIACYAGTEIANGEQCTCAIDNFYNGTHCEGCQTGTRLQGDAKNTPTTCCTGGYQNQPNTECIAYTNTDHCNAERKTINEGDRNTDASCGNECISDIVPITFDGQTYELCDGRTARVTWNGYHNIQEVQQSTFNAYNTEGHIGGPVHGFENNETVQDIYNIQSAISQTRYFVCTIHPNAKFATTCSSTVQTAEYASETQCITYTETQASCNQQRKPFQAGTNTEDSSCGSICLNTQYASGTQCIGYTETQASCNQQRKPFQAGTNTEDSSCGSTCLNTQYASGTQCITYTETQASCNQQRKTFQAGTTTEDASCGDPCHHTEYASGTQCIGYTETQTSCNTQRKTFSAGTTTGDSSCGSTCTNTEYASGTQCIAYTETQTSCNTQGKPFIEGGPATDSSCGQPCATGHTATGTQCIQDDAQICTVTKPISAVDHNIVTGVNINCAGTLVEGETCLAQCNDNYVKLSDGNCTAEGYQPAQCICNQHGYYEDGIGNCKTCDSGSFLVNTQCIQWTVTPEQCNYNENKPFVAGDALTDASCGETCAEGLKAEHNRCVHPSSKITCDALSWIYMDGICEDINNQPPCIHMLDRNVKGTLTSFSDLKRSNGDQCQDSDQIVYQQGNLLCQATSTA